MARCRNAFRKSDSVRTRSTCIREQLRSCDQALQSIHALEFRHRTDQEEPVPELSLRPIERNTNRLTPACASLADDLQVVYDQAFDLDDELKCRSTSLTDFPPMVMPESALGPLPSSYAGYSSDVHLHLNQLHQRLLQSIRRTLNSPECDSQQTLLSR